MPTDVTVDCTSIPAVANVTASDNCDTDVALVFTEITGNGCPYEITRRWVATDDCGNVDSVIQVITVEDNTLPVLANVPNDATVECTSIPTASIVTASDNCIGNLPVSFSEVIGTGCPYIITRTLSATDSCGHEAIGT